jgi:hypothetical protein
MDNEEKELRDLNAALGEQIHEEYWIKVVAILERLGELPVEARTGIAQAVAEVLRCRVILQAAIMEGVPNNPDMFRIIEHREIMIADPIVPHGVYG